MLSRPKHILFVILQDHMVTSNAQIDSQTATVLKRLEDKLILENRIWLPRRSKHDPQEDDSERVSSEDVCFSLINDKTYTYETLLFGNLSRKVLVAGHESHDKRRKAETHQKRRKVQNPSILKWRRPRRCKADLRPPNLVLVRFSAALFRYGKAQFKCIPHSI